MRLARLKGIMIGLLLGIITPVIAEEEITLVTYYPAPRGVYKELRTTDNTYLATQAGKVGIGTTNPLVRLHLLSPGATAVDPFGSDVLFNGTQQYVASYTSTNAGYAGFLLQSRTGGARPFVQFANSTPSLYTLMLDSSNVFQMIEGNALGTPRLVINNGDVGIGTTAPDSALHVIGDITFGDFTDHGHLYGDGPAVRLTNNSEVGGINILQSNGNVGIGTTSPQSLLQVASNYIQFPTISGAAPASADCDAAAEAGRVVVRTDGTANLYICTGAGGWVSK